MSSEAISSGVGVRPIPEATGCAIATTTTPVAVTAAVAMPSLRLTVRPMVVNHPDLDAVVVVVAVGTRGHATCGEQRLARRLHVAGVVVTPRAQRGRAAVPAP